MSAMGRKPLVSIDLVSREHALSLMTQPKNLTVNEAAKRTGVAEPTLCA